MKEELEVGDLVVFIGEIKNSYPLPGIILELHGFKNKWGYVRMEPYSRLIRCSIKPWFHPVKIISKVKKNEGRKV